MRLTREQVLRDLTFWLRPDFVLRCLRRFQALEGFDRAIALASLSFTALVPLGIVTGGVLSDEDVGHRIVERLELEGKGATAVVDLFSRGEDLKSGFTVFSAFLLVVALLSFTRALQRLFERAWGLAPLSVRNTKNGLVWIAGLVAYTTVAGLVRAAVDGPVLDAVTAIVLWTAGLAFTLWTGRVLTDRRVTWRQLLPAAILVATLAVVVGVVSDVYVPRLFNSYATRYGALGAVLAGIAWLFATMIVLVASVAVGREVWAELESIRRGDRPSNAQIEADWAALRERVEQRRSEVGERARGLRERARARRGNRGA